MNKRWKTNQTSSFITTAVNDIFEMLKLNEVNWKLASVLQQEHQFVVEINNNER